MTSRRNFIKRAAGAAAGVGLSGTATSLSAKSYSKVMGANDRIMVALQGLGRRYGAFMPSILDKKNNVELVYWCDVMPPALEKAAKKYDKDLGYKPKQENDIRKVMDDSKIDAIFMATPDHWHTPGACMAMAAGKHVYLEKPCSHNGRESELVVEYQKHYNKVVQMGNQQRSAPESQEVIQAIHSGAIGTPYRAVAFYTNTRGEVPKPKKAVPPSGLDWDLFQGPSPRKEYMDDTWNYNWHWYGWDFGTAEMGNNATHELDIARWALQVMYPSSVDVIADKYQFKDDGWEMYDYMYATFNFPDGKTIHWDGASRNGYSTYGSGRGTIIYGSEGSVNMNRNGYKMYDLKGELVKEGKAGSAEAGTALGGGGSMSTRHAVNFFNTIRGTEELTSPIEIGAISQQLTHYANMAYRIDRGFEIDEHTGRPFDREAHQLWSRTYEPGWEIKPV